MASQYPKRFYGLHMAEGTAEYREPDKEPYKIYVGDKAISNMNASFEGRPVFVGHQEDVGPDRQPDGHVIKSFYNNLDGKTWCEFIVTSDKGMDAINNGFRLSNAYIIKESGLGGRWHGMDYDKEVINGEYDHLAIVDDPRYDESVIMTPNEFKEYCKQKEQELESVKNSKNEKPKKGKGMLNFFKKEKVENSADLESMSVVLPRSKKEIDVKKLINEMDEIAVKAKNGEDKYADDEMLVKVNEDEEMSVKEIVNKYKNMCDKMKKQNEEEEEEKKKENEGKEEEEKENEEEEKKEENEEEEEKEEKKKNSDSFKKINNAGNYNEASDILDTSFDQLERGKARYGSN